MRDDEDRVPGAPGDDSGHVAQIDAAAAGDVRAKPVDSRPQPEARELVCHPRGGACRRWGSGGTVGEPDSQLLCEPVRGGVVERGLEGRGRLRKGRGPGDRECRGQERDGDDDPGHPVQAPADGALDRAGTCPARAARGGEGLGNGAAIVGRAYPRLMSNPATILLVDDEEAVQKLLAYPLERDGYRVVQARDGDEALRQFEEHPVDLVVLDLMLPKLDGLEVCKRLRAVSHVPIIMLTARDDEVDKVLGLELGADDYITKPFSIREFRSRVKAALRRAAAPKHDADGQEAISIDGLVVDPARRAVEMNGEPVELTYVEFELLSTLASKPGRVYSRQALLVALWGDSAYRDPRTIDVHVRHLREKLEPTPSEPQFILTVRGVGYRFRDA